MNSIAYVPIQAITIAIAIELQGTISTGRLVQLLGIDGRTCYAICRRFERVNFIERLEGDSTLCWRARPILGEAIVQMRLLMSWRAFDRG